MPLLRPSRAAGPAGDVRVNGISRGLALREGFQVIRRQLQGTGNTGIDVIALLEVNVFEKVSAHAACGDGVAVHVDAGQVGDGALHRH